jgi:hypothetical protein
VLRRRGGRLLVVQVLLDVVVDLGRRPRLCDGEIVQNAFTGSRPALSR